MYLFGRILVIVLCVIFWWPNTGPAEAACTGSGTSWICTPGSTSSDVQGALYTAADGATIIFQPGGYSMTAFARFQLDKSATLLCGTPPLSNGAATTNSCTIDVSGNPNAPTFGTDQFGSGNYNKCYRISGFIFDAGGTVPPAYGATIWFSNYAGGASGGVASCIRVDHNTFQNAARSSHHGVAFGHSSTPYNWGNYYGVIDHNTWSNSTNLVMLMWVNAINNPPTAAHSGTSNNIFFEDNVATFGGMDPSGEGCTDGWGGMAVVFRFNTFTNCRVSVHGEKHEGGPANIEVYGNRIAFDNGAASGNTFFQDGTWAVQHQGSGEYTVFNNSFSATLGRSNWVIETQDYRSSPAGNPTGYTPELGSNIPICDGTVTNFGGIVKDGNRSGGYPCWRQVGRDNLGVLKPIYIWNNFWADTLAQAPFQLNDIGGSPDYFSNHLQANRDYYVAVSASPQANPTAPFTGSTGMGFGTLANRPATCTPTADPLDAGQGGVAYWAWDQGSWKTATSAQGQWPQPPGTSGILYTCSATNTWTVHYTPFLYPHPLQTMGNGAPPSAPTNLTVR